MVGALPIETGKYRYQPDPDFVQQSSREYIISQHGLAAVVGAIAIGMPLAMSIASLGITCPYDSISHFYYSRILGDVFVGSLVVIGTFLIAYRGENSRENIYASVAGFCAYGVALFPTTESGLEDGMICSGRAFYRGDVADPPYIFELFPNSGLLHYLSAAVLFAFLAYYSLHVFTRIIAHIHEDASGHLLPQKQARNRIYYTSGAIIIISMSSIGMNMAFDFTSWKANNLTFWFEALALWAFGISWIVKGRLFNLAFLDQRDIPLKYKSS